MTIPSTPRKAGPLLGNGVTTSFPFAFKVFAPTDVKVVIADSAGVETVLVLDSDYTVTLNPNQDTSPGGVITYPISGSPLPSGSVLSIIGNIDYDQPLDLPSGGNFSPLALENQLDRTTMQIQQLREEMDRAVKLPPTSSESVEDLVGDLQRIADSADNLDTVANNIADVNTVAANIADVTTVADNVTDITNFADVYQGGKAADPALRNDGSALQPGDLYFNTTTGRLRVFDGTVWREGNAGSITVERFSGNGSQTAFTLNTAPSDENNTQVYISGVYQQKNTYNVSGTTLTFDVAPPAGTNNIEVVVMRVLPLGNADASLISFLPAGTGAAATTVEAKLRAQRIDVVVDFGADPTGVNDSTSAINAAIDEGIASGRTVFIPSGEYRYDGYTCNKTDAFRVAIEGEAGNLPILRPSQAKVDAGNYMFLFPATRYSQVTGLALASEIKPGQVNIALTSVAGLEVGMVIQISSDRLWYNGSRGVKYCGEIHVINSIDAGNNVITIDDYTRDHYTTSQTLVIRAWRPNTVSIKNLRLEAPYPASNVTSVGIQLQQSVNSVIENVHCKGFIYRCFSDNLSVKSRYNNISCTQDSSMPTDIVGYGLATEGTLGLIVDGFRSVGQRRAFDADGLEGTAEAAIARDWMVTNFNVSGGGAWFPATAAPSYGLGMHGASENGIFCDGFISSVGYGINARGRNTTVSNVVFSGPMNSVIGLYEEGAGIKISGCVYDSFTYPNKMADLSLISPSAGCVNFLTLGINVTTGIVHYDLPIIVENNVAKGVKSAFILMYAPPATGVIENLFVSNNQVEGLAGAGNTMTFLDVANTGYINSAVLMNNYLKAVTGDILLYDLNLTLGQRKPSDPTVQTMVDGAYYVTIADDTVVRLPHVDRGGNRILVSVKVRNDTSYLMVLVPESTTVTNVANKPATVVATASGSSMTGTTGDDGNMTFGLMQNGDLWIENRTGSARQMKIKVL